MGFESEYERGLRDRRWGKALKAFTIGSSVEDAAAFVERGLCADLRDGLLPISGLCKVASEFEHCHKMLADSSLLLFEVEGSSQRDILEHHSERCNRILREYADNPGLVRFVDQACESLIEFCRSGNAIKMNSGEITQSLLDRFLRQHAADRLYPALVVSTESRHQNPKEVESRKLAIQSTLRLDRVIKDIKIDKSKICAPRRCRPAVGIIVDQPLAIDERLVYA